MIQKNFMFFVLVALFINASFTNQEAISVLDTKIEQKIQPKKSKTLRFARGSILSSGAIACAYMNALIIDWCLSKVIEPDNYIQKNFIDKIGTFFFEDMDITSKMWGISKAKLLTSALIGIPIASLGLYLTNLAINEFKYCINNKKNKTERLDE